MESDSSDSSDLSTGSDYDLNISNYAQQKKCIKQFYINHPEYKNIKEGDKIWWITKPPKYGDPEYIVPFNEIPFTVVWTAHDCGLIQIEYSGRFYWEIDIYELFIEDPTWEDIVARKLELKL